MPSIQKKKAYTAPLHDCEKRLLRYTASQDYEIFLKDEAALKAILPRLSLSIGARRTSLYNLYMPLLSEAAVGDW
jgi:hypothetical protein